MNKKTLTAAAAALVLATGILTGCGAVTADTASPATAPTVSVSAATGTVLPVSTNPISNASTAPGLSIPAAAAEDLVDPATGKALDDRLQLTLANGTDTDVTQVEIYYQMTDVTTQQSEGYYMALDGVTLPAHGETVVYFDNSGQPGHFPENDFSLYRTSENQVDFTIEASAPGLQIATTTATKGAGAGDLPD